MESAPKWYTPVAVIALIWNLIGCAAYVADVMLSPEAIAQMSAEAQALYAARPAWSVGATAIAVWFGALGCLGLVMKKRWSAPLLLVSLLGVILQDLYLFVLSDAASLAGGAAYAMQGLVLVIAVWLVTFSRKAVKQGWVA